MQQIISSKVHMNRMNLCFQILWPSRIITLLPPWILEFQFFGAFTDFSLSGVPNQRIGVFRSGNEIAHFKQDIHSVTDLGDFGGSDERKGQGLRNWVFACSISSLPIQCACAFSEANLDFWFLIQVSGLTPGDAHRVLHRAGSREKRNVLYHIRKGTIIQQV